jgi:hypothetical protein
MSGSTEPQAALVSIEEQRTIMALLDIQSDTVGFEKLKEAFGQRQEVLTEVTH